MAGVRVPPVPRPSEHRGARCARTPSEVRRPRSGPVWPGKNRANETASIYNESETLVQSSLNIPSKLPRTGPQVSYRATTTGTLSLSTNKRVRRTRLTRTVTSRPRQIVTSVYRDPASRSLRSGHEARTYIHPRAHANDVAPPLGAPRLVSSASRPLTSRQWLAHPPLSHAAELGA